MKYKKVTPNSYFWLKVLYTVWLILSLSCIVVYCINKSIIALSGIVAMVLIGVMFIATARHINIYKARKMSRLIHNHIKENDLCQTELNGRKEIYTFYPKAYWKIDKSINTLFIRFRFTGNKINVRDLERGLADRLEMLCLNVYESRSHIEYLFELVEEKPLIIDDREDIQGEYGNTVIPLSLSFTWDYRKMPHFLISGSTGSGKTTFTRYLIAHLLKRGVRIVYIDVKRDTEMEQFCHGNAITYAYEPETIAKVISEIADEIQSRTNDIENTGIGEDFDYGFNPVFVICDEIILMKLVFPDKLYKQTIANINKIIVGGRSKNIFCGLVTQSALAEYFGNSGIRGNIHLRVSLGQATSTELGMIFGDKFSDIKNLRYGEIGSGLLYRNGFDSRPREFIAPYIKEGVLD